MAAIAIADCTLKGAGTFIERVKDYALDNNRPRFRKAIITLGATADDGDTAVVDIFTEFGMTKFYGAFGWIQTTANSVVVEEAPTTIMNGTSLTLTVGGSTDNKQRTYVILGV